MRVPTHLSDDAAMHWARGYMAALADVRAALPQLADAYAASDYMESRYAWPIARHMAAAFDAVFGREGANDA